MSEETIRYMVKPDSNGTPLLPKRNAPKGLLPSTWLYRSVRVEYADALGLRVETSGTLLDLYPVGPILNLAGVKTLVSWDRLGLVELVED